MNGDREKYGAWVRALETRRIALRRERPKLAWLLVLGIVTAPLGLFASRLAALFIFGGWAGAWLSALYISMAREGDFTRQLEATRRDLEERTRAQNDQHQDIDAPPQPDKWKAQRQARRAAL
jgi:hypothetical protein